MVSRRERGPHSQGLGKERSALGAAVEVSWGGTSHRMERSKITEEENTVSVRRVSASASSCDWQPAEERKDARTGLHVGPGARWWTG